MARIPWWHQIRSPLRRETSVIITLLVLAILVWANVIEMSGRQVVRSTTGSLQIKLLIRAIIFLIGAFSWTSFAKAFMNNHDRGISWWRLLEMYFVTNLLIAPHAIYDGWSLSNGGSVLPWSALYDKLIQLVVFWVWTIKLAKVPHPHPVPRRI